MNEITRFALDIADRTVRERIGGAGEVVATRELIAECAELGKSVAEQVSSASGEDVDAELIRRELLATFEILMGETYGLVDHQDHIDWYAEARAVRDWKYWERYRKYLSGVKHWPESVVRSIDRSTDMILEVLEDPERTGRWDRRGLVVGHVQSGKTANYVGLINKAVDAGYKVIIVLAGMHNSLRSQTQIRLEEGLTGLDTAGRHRQGSDTKARPVGVGEIRLGEDYAVQVVTNRDDRGDFNREAAKHLHIQPGGAPLLMVVKKHGSVLRNVIEWVRLAGKEMPDGSVKVRNVPLLLVDDEADQATVDTAGKKGEDPDADDYSPSRINGRIRELLHAFERSAYVGYTATPFANVLIRKGGSHAKHGEDLFPRSFIYSLPTPTNYVGPGSLFPSENGDRNQPSEGHGIQPITDAGFSTAAEEDPEDWMPLKHRKDWIPSIRGSQNIPGSLAEAIRVFVITSAMRMERGLDDSHMSMLVHVTRFVNVQDEVFDQVSAFLEDVKHGLRYEDIESGRQWSEMRDVWEAEFGGLALEDSTASRDEYWTSLGPLIRQVIEKAEVLLINGTASDVLDYDDDTTGKRRVIAIGGDKLSRGLTLEGLSVSYFLRASRMYDTLMQMGRWFGFRPGYQDLCRIYTTDDLAEWFAIIASASQELREDFERMVELGRTPDDFGHRVRTHPGLLVTSQLKMKNGERRAVEFSGASFETLSFNRDLDSIGKNVSAAEDLVAKCRSFGGAERIDSKVLGWRSVEVDSVVQFLRAYCVCGATGNRDRPELIAQYIEKESGLGRLVDWSVVVGVGKGVEIPASVLGEPVRSVRRLWDLNGNVASEELTRESLIREGRLRLRGSSDRNTEGLHLRQEELDAAFEVALRLWEADGKVTPEPKRGEPSRATLKTWLPESRGLLTLYPLQSLDRQDKTGVRYSAFVEEGAEAPERPLISFMLTLPAIGGQASRVEYIVNQTYVESEDPDGPDD